MQGNEGTSSHPHFLYHTLPTVEPMPLAHPLPHTLASSIALSDINSDSAAVAVSFMMQHFAGTEIRYCVDMVFLEICFSAMMPLQPHQPSSAYPPSHTSFNSAGLVTDWWPNRQSDRVAITFVRSSKCSSVYGESTRASHIRAARLACQNFH
jgi:hypothetical protein